MGKERGWAGLPRHRPKKKEKEKKKKNSKKGEREDAVGRDDVAHTTPVGKGQKRKGESEKTRMSTNGGRRTLREEAEGAILYYFKTEKEAADRRRRSSNLKQ